MLTAPLLLAFRTLVNPVQNTPAGATHVRSTQSSLLALLTEGAERSATFRELIARLNDTDVIVYVEPGICGFGGLNVCLPHSIVAAGGVRYLRVILDRHLVSDAQAIALVGHELQRALEIADAAHIRTSEEIDRLFSGRQTSVVTRWCRHAGPREGGRPAG